MASLSLDHELVALERLLGDADLHGFHPGQIRRHEERTAFVERQLGIDESAMVLRQRTRAGEAARLLARGQGDDQMRESFCCPRATSSARERGGHRLVVAHAARIEIPVLLGRFERRDRPGLPFDGDHVDVRQEEEGLLRARAAHACHQVAASRRRLDQLRGHAGFLEPVQQWFERRRLVPMARVDAQKGVQNFTRLGFDGSRGE